MKPLLTILVPTLACRDKFYARLEQCLMPQLGTDVELLKLRDDGEQTIGAKRQRLLESAVTPFVAFVDDDDLVAPDYCQRIISGIREHDPDVIGFRLAQFDDGDLSARTIHSVTAKSWHSQWIPGQLPQHYRTPNHLNPVRREMALSIGYDDTRNWGEDSLYSEQLFERYPDMREHFIDAELYLYYRRSAQFREGERVNPV